MPDTLCGYLNGRAGCPYFPSPFPLDNKPPDAGCVKGQNHEIFFKADTHANSLTAKEVKGESSL